MSFYRACNPAAGSVVEVGGQEVDGQGVVAERFGRVLKFFVGFGYLTDSEERPRSLGRN